MVAGFEVDFSRLLVAVIHERGFEASTTYPFPYMNFELYRAAGGTICHINVLRTSTGIVDIDLIKDEANEAAPNTGPRVGVQPLGENLSNMVEQVQGADQADL